jgi:hypothetical protein
VNNTNPCNDDNACTTGDVCSGGTCVGGPPLTCDDANVCTTDTCNPGTGCVHTNNNNPCSDGNACTNGDACSGGACVGGPPLSCDDGNVCTTDSCNPPTGCTHADNTNPCNDGNACTTSDVCSAGVCVGGPPRLCDDGNICTDDSCDPGTGCVFANNSDPCSDGNACTAGDACSGGRCVGGPPLNCDDDDPCTEDTCTAGGCNHENTACGACCLPAGPCADHVTAEGCADIVPGGGVFQGVGSVCMGDADDNGLDDLCDTGGTIPTVSEWGLVILTLLLLTGAKIYFSRRPSVVLAGVNR